MSSKTKPSFEAQAGDETGRAEKRRRDLGYFEKYLKGKGLDVGAGKRSVVEGCDTWDIAQGDGDGALLARIPDASYDWVYASHILEHIDNPLEALENWWRVLRVGGFLVVAVPDEDLYEQGIWPSIFNPDHRTSWTIHKDCSWAPESRNLVELVQRLPGHKILRMTIEDDGYDYDCKRRDQPGAERQVEVVVQKVGPPPEALESFLGRIMCSCGAGQVVILGWRIDGQMIVRCQACGQRSGLNMIGMLKQASEASRGG